MPVGRHKCTCTAARSTSASSPLSTRRPRGPQTATPPVHGTPSSPRRWTESAPPPPRRRCSRRRHRRRRQTRPRKSRAVGHVYRNSYWSVRERFHLAWPRLRYGHL